MKNKLDVSRFIEINEIPPASQSRFLVGAGDSRAGQLGVAIATIAVKGARGYGVIIHLDSGKQDCFDPQQLFPDLS